MLSPEWVIIPLEFLIISYTYKMASDEDPEDSNQLMILFCMLTIQFLAGLDFIWHGQAMVEGAYCALESLLVISAIGGIHGMVRRSNRCSSDYSVNSSVLLDNKEQGNKLCQ